MLNCFPMLANVGKILQKGSGVHLVIASSRNPHHPVLQPVLQLPPAQLRRDTEIQQMLPQGPWRYWGHSACSIAFQCWQMLARFCKKDLAFTWSSHRPGTRTIRCCSPYCSCHQHSQHNCAEIQRYNKCFHKVPEDIGATMFNITIVLSVLISECRVAFRLTEEIQGSACSIVFQCW